MNTFAAIEPVLSFPKVKYYTVRIDNAELTEFGKFVAEHISNKSISEEFNDLLQWIQLRLGTRHGALQPYFRKEKSAQALPPYVEHLSIAYKKNLRLYCYRISDHVVVLFNGGIKSKGIKYAQKCPIVSTHFYTANKLSNAIKLAMSSKNIQLNAEQTELIITPGLKLPL